ECQTPTHVRHRDTPIPKGVGASQFCGNITFVFRRIWLVSGCSFAPAMGLVGVVVLRGHTLCFPMVLVGGWGVLLLRIWMVLVMVVEVLHSTPPRYQSFRRALSLFCTKPPSLSFSGELSLPVGPLRAGVVVVADLSLVLCGLCVVVSFVGVEMVAGGLGLRWWSWYSCDVVCLDNTCSVSESVCVLFGDGGGVVAVATILCWRCCEGVVVRC
ncbi:hypothetical protein A2U01_0000492, partial [Trifolium medium]|nr:hypothetical protein [Trifolium medium]